MTRLLIRLFVKNSEDTANPAVRKSYGTLTDVMQTGANDVYEVKDASGKAVLIPAIPDVIQETDLAGGVMRIRPLEGLLDAN